MYIYNTVYILYLHYLVHFIFPTLEEEEVIYLQFPPHIQFIKQVEGKGYG